MNAIPPAKIQIGVAGAGAWGTNLLRNFAGIGALAAFFEPDPGRRAKAAAQYPSARSHAAFADLAADPGISAIVVATPAITHAALVREGLAAGKHVFVEKPLCLDPAEAASLVAMAHERKLTLMVGHLMLYHPAFRALKDFVTSGRIGTLRYIYSNRLNLGRIRGDENALWSFAPHDVSIILDLVGAMPHKVVANGGAYLKPGIADMTLSHLTFPKDVQAHIFVSWLHPYKDHRLVVVGSDGMLELNDSQPTPRKLLHYPHVIEWRDGVPVIDRAEAQPIPFPETEPLRLECTHFLDCVADGKKPVSDGTEGLRVLTVLDACQRSLAGGMPVTLETPALQKV